MSAAKAGSSEAVLDALIIGAGLSGIYQLYKARERDWSVLAVEAADGVGGTWHWNRYPGARVDSESYSYGYFFSPELLADWNWTEHFASQPENEAYLNHVVDRFGLREHIRLQTTVTTARFDDDTDTWIVDLSDGSLLHTRFLITAVGILSAPQYPSAPGRDTFAGPAHHTARWPKEGVNVADKRVAVIGTGSSGVQIITAIADDVADLIVFQRTPNWCPPLNNAPLSAAEMAEIKSRYDNIWKSCQNLGGSVYDPPVELGHDVTPERRRKFFEHLFTEKRGLAPLYANYLDLLTDKEINREFANFIAERIRARVDDPDIADLLIPTDHLFAVKRPPLETGYYELYNRANVHLVDLRSTPIERFTPTGITTEAADYDVHVIVFATGFDAVTGAFERIEFAGNDGATLRDAWRDGPNTHTGIATPGFPNLLYAGGPQSLAGNIPRVVEHQVDFITDLIQHANDAGSTRVECTAQSATVWTNHVEETVAATIFADGQSWMYGSNVAGKPRAFGLYAGGLTNYVERLAAIRNTGFEGFVLQ
jgi:cation diffusion facilitator CzcD-associated flavoprotein CzcO